MGARCSSACQNQAKDQIEKVMKSRNYTLMAIFIAAVTLVHWWFNLPGPLTKTSVDSGNLPGALAPRAILPASQNSHPPPTESVARPEITGPAPAPAVEPTPSADPQSSLKTAIPDLVRRLRSGDRVDAYKAYTPPNEFDAQIIQQMQESQLQALAVAAQDPAFRQILQKNQDEVAQAYEALEDQTPTLDATGDEATYEISMPGSGKGPVIFVNVDGKWYLRHISGR